VTSDLTKFQGLPDVETGELLEPTIGNAARVLVAARAKVNQIHAIVQEATEFLVEMSEHQGTKTLHGDDETVKLNGGPTVDYDHERLRDELWAAGCPTSRIDAALPATVTYKANRSVLRQLAGANPKYRAAIERAQIEVEKPYRASVKLRRADD
jgi:hypothetical protein